jgi:hypothetical protein
MTTSKTAHQKKEEFLYPQPPLNSDTDMTFYEMAQINNLNNFSHHVSYLTSMSIGNKLAVEDAYKEIKKLYKAMKQSHKSLKGSWF